MNKENFKQQIRDWLLYHYGKTVEEANDNEKYHAVSHTVMNRLKDSWKETSENAKYDRKAYYFSAEFLIGRSLGNNLLNFGITEEVVGALEELGINLNRMEEQEEDAALGNGGLGRLAACFMDSGASLELPMMGYGVLYTQGLFKQGFENGFQTEKGDDWTDEMDPWFNRIESDSQIIHFKNQSVVAIPYDYPVIGYHNGYINKLRLWKAEPIEAFDFQKFNNFQFNEAVAEKNRAEDITRVLYPNDIQDQGKILRLKQQYFFCSASIKDMVQMYERNFPEDKSFSNFPKYHIIQLNDTHPVMAVIELLRILIDEKNLSWEDACHIVNRCFAFTNHTILQEALEKWPLHIVEEANPRALEIIKEIDRRFVEYLNNLYYSAEKIEEIRIIANGQVRMANIALYIGTKVNGVAQIHTEILKNKELKPWYDLYPEKFVNKTNGISPRRWLMYSNPELSEFITELIGDQWKNDLTELEKLMEFIEDDQVLNRLMEIKHRNKEKLRDYILKEEGVEIDPDSIYDIQVKRLHEYKRQLLNAFHILDLYYRIKENPDLDIHKRTFIFGAKAAPGYFRAKAIIKFINEVGRLVNEDPVVSKKIQVVFVENFRVTYGEKIYPAADLSEQISTAGKEASGTGNMKFMLNGAPTIGTLDGANIEIFEQAGEENNFRFGSTVDELHGIYDQYNPKEYYHCNEDIKRVVDTLLSDRISDAGSYMFLDIYNSLIDPQFGQKADEYFVLKDFHAYKAAQEEVDKAYKDRRSWAQKCLANIAGSGKFSSDRTIKEYAEEIWKIEKNS
ncbi:MAG: glycogen/starch/alpha-glucan phosphorylase [Tissierellia bacterium]|nr:glycogen/starch/alpha-glucan phosphorylase [Tissierellia bacterium]